MRARVLFDFAVNVLGCWGFVGLLVLVVCRRVKKTNQRFIRKRKKKKLVRQREHSHPGAWVSWAKVFDLAAFLLSFSNNTPTSHIRTRTGTHRGPSPKNTPPKNNNSVALLTALKTHRHCPLSFSSDQHDATTATADKQSESDYPPRVNKDHRRVLW